MTNVCPPWEEKLSQVTRIPMESETATAKARRSRMGVAISSAIVPKPILQCKENTHCLSLPLTHDSSHLRQLSRLACDT